MDDEDALPPLPQLTMSRSAPLRTLQAPPLIEIDGEEPVLSTSVPIEHTPLGLPPEMRNAIYRYVLVKPDPLEVSPGRPYAYKPAFLSTCRQIRAEADGIFMNENTFTTDPGFHGYGITIPYWHWLNKSGGPMMKGRWEALPWSETTVRSPSPKRPAATINAPSNVVSSTLWTYWVSLKAWLGSWKAVGRFWVVPE
ncbi:hypothetical protein LTR56_025254 [Elasticomyces elasticus]|nr:hypothetical protein LTR56_025254 [Elasticomyces elasticus]KAK3646171.1 hypothetical protein LTR22_014383 [Elasticomyces elasticus]KAK4904475.1 hypothetical protein LTR49_026077 [Elasticomyces elasticus]KAK5739738.1 hypothetical protein LTS12_025163 [Elasticomyces elasticus]